MYGSRSKGDLQNTAAGNMTDVVPLAIHVFGLPVVPQLPRLPTLLPDTSDRRDLNFRHLPGPTGHPERFPLRTLAQARLESYRVRHGISHMTSFLEGLRISPRPPGDPQNAPSCLILRDMDRAEGPKFFRTSSRTWGGRSRTSYSLGIQVPSQKVIGDY